MYYMLFHNFLSNILFYLFIYINSQFNSLSLYIYIYIYIYIYMNVLRLVLCSWQQKLIIIFIRMVNLAFKISIPCSYLFVEASLKSLFRYGVDMRRWIFQNLLHVLKSQTFYPFLLCCSWKIGYHQKVLIKEYRDRWSKCMEN